MSLRNLFLRTALLKNPFICVTAAAIKNRNKKQYGNGREYHKCFEKENVAAVLFGSILVGSAIKDQIDSREPANEGAQSGNQNSENVTVEAGIKRPDLPTYSAEEVSKHDDKSSFWVTYKHGVYDVTKFLSSHPGGEQIMNAAGLSIEPFWNVYGMHKTQEVFKLLESFRIGNLHDDDVVDHSDDELWVKEPFRDKRLIVKTAKPFNAEIPAKLQVEYFDTPKYVDGHDGSYCFINPRVGGGVYVLK